MKELTAGVKYDSGIIGRFVGMKVAAKTPNLKWEQWKDARVEDFFTPEWIYKGPSEHGVWPVFKE